MTAKAPDSDNQIDFLVDQIEQQRDRASRPVVDHIWPALEAYKRAHGGCAMAAPLASVDARPTTGGVTGISSRKATRKSAA